MKTVIVIQARLGSSRLPCKTLLNLHGLPVIDWVVGRCARSELADDLVVALPDTRRDEVLARHLRAQGVNTFRGSEQDVLSRMHGAAAAHGADLVVRVCADNPLIWGGEIDNLIRFYQREHTAGNCDYAYNHIPRNNLYPDGLGAEILSVSQYAFERIVEIRLHELVFGNISPQDIVLHRKTVERQGGERRLGDLHPRFGWGDAESEFQVVHYLCSIRLSPVISGDFSIPISSTMVGAISPRRPPERSAGRYSLSST